MKLRISALALAFITATFLYYQYAPDPILSNNQDPLTKDKLSGKYDPLARPIFLNKPVTPPPYLADAEDVLGKKKSSKEKRIEIDLSKQKLYAIEGNKKTMSFLVSTGKWGATPTGEFRTWTKLKYTLMSGGSKALGTYYYLPNVPYTMFFYNDAVPKHRGYGIHGTYWHNNFGHPMSHGCINMKTEEAEKLFAWAEVNTKIVIYGSAPNE